MDVTLFNIKNDVLRFNATEHYTIDNRVFHNFPTSWDKLPYPEFIRKILILTPLKNFRVLRPYLFLVPEILSKLQGIQFLFFYIFDKVCPTSY